MNIAIGINWVYIISALFFTFGLKLLGSPETARKGNILSAFGMLLAIIVTLWDQQIITYTWIVAGMLIGIVVGVLAARLISMTAMPEMVALLNGFGGIASLLVGWSVYAISPEMGIFTATSVIFSILIGGLTFSGSLTAWAKLKELMTGKPIIYVGQQVVNALILLGILGCGIMFVLGPEQGMTYFYIIIGLSLLFGVMSVLPIGGADMPVVISLLNSYSGIAACATGFVIHNNLLIVAGSLVGASGIILTNIMCKAMNRSISHVLFSGFGSATSGGVSVEGEAKSLSPQDAYYVLESAQSVVIVPGYGLAVAQAQHVVRELGELLENNGAEVRYAIHPVAGRMPGHMNVLLAEANVPYDQLIEMDDINSTMEMVDVCLVIGANDVVNPAARDDEGSPIYGMPIINVDYAKFVFVLKRSMGTGFAGIQNPLFFKENTRMIFGDAKETLTHLLTEFK
ncbi:MAG: NAD(P)(+) transhydrogenase (Re/Si-specific) subunit beta [Candidatus Margulisbacteria bacterium]|nr:NAD(P)(+) transhydrogenase (Re/Si-specific) subunit beta [Candidatus Margulisiibacteriota bacterium]